MEKFTKDEIEEDVKDAEVIKADDNGALKQELSETDDSEALKQEPSETDDSGAPKHDSPESNNSGESEKAEEKSGDKEPVGEKETAEGQKLSENTKDSAGETQESTVEKEKDGAEKAAVGKSRKKGRIFALVLVLAVLTVMVVIYIRGVCYYKRNFFPQLQINEIGCGKLTLQEAADKVQQWYTDNYRLELLNKSGEEMAVILPSDIEMAFPLEEELAKILEGQNAYKWFIYVLAKEGVSKEIVISPRYDRAKLQKLLEQKGLFDASRGEAPQNAYISEYQEDLKQFVIVPEKEGTVLTQEMTVMCVAEALTDMQDSLNLYEAGCFKTAEITADNEALQTRLKALNQVVGTCITYDWNGAQEILDGELIHQWLVLDGEEIGLDEEQIAAYVAQKAKEYDTYGKKRNFVTTSGLTLTLPSGAYGWKTDRKAETEALIELILAGAVTEREPIYISQGWVKGADDIGDSYVEINLTDQHLYLYIDGELILETDFVSGNAANGNSTPAGVFGLTYKTKNAVLRGPDYETPVNYWMPFNGNVGMHDATWRRSFGGDIYLTNGSHGCINLPLKMAKEIYGYMSAGFPVICYYY